MAKTKWPKLPRYLIPLFHSARIYLCVTKEQWQQALKCLNVPPQNLSYSNGRTMHFCDDETGENMYLVGVFDGLLSTLVHECAHATFYVCNDTGIDIDTGQRNETYCYLLDRMFSHFLPYIQKDQINE
ncbi:hypothetical protein [Kosakonia radicincitans]|uniref:hypothetical protein n=1 Tax=Kosakonia radicincitans TaxID=283686 RepID=UPI001D092A5A|nr:hypothetical protein [Kosakonia radicincitans]